MPLAETELENQPAAVRTPAGYLGAEMNLVLFTVIFQGMFWGGIAFVVVAAVLFVLLALAGVGACPKPPVLPDEYK
jgi:hypothetical protein